MPVNAIITTVLILAALAAMATNRVRPELALFAALAVTVLAGVLDPAQALSGFSNQGLHTVAVLFVVAEAVRRSGALGLLTRLALGNNGSQAVAQARLVLPAAFASAFMNNTPLVAMLMPAVRRWTLKNNMPASRFLIPLSYASILGGMCTLIGTSTNLVVAGILSAEGYASPGFFDIGRVGLPAAVAGTAVVLLLGRLLLPDRSDSRSSGNDPRSFTAEFVVDGQPGLAGKRLDEVKIGDVAGLHPVEIIRGAVIVPAPQGGELMQAGDRLVFAGSLDELLELQKVAGLRGADEVQFGGNEPLRRRRQVELVISDRCPLIGHRVGDGSFRNRYNAAVIAVTRHGERLPRRGLKGWRLRAGDTLLVEAAPGFAVQNRFNPDFHLVGDRPEQFAGRMWQLRGALVVVALMAIAAAIGLTTMFKAALAASLVLIALRIIRWHQALSSLDAGVLLAIAASLGLGEALRQSGAAGLLAGAVVRAGGADPHVTLVLLYAATVMITEVVTNNAAAVLMTPLALAAAQALGVNYQPFVFAVMIAASASFMTPIGYQTNLMVYGPGGYRFTDYFRLGLPVSLAVAAVTIGLAPVIWPF